MRSNGSKYSNTSTNIRILPFSSSSCKKIYIFMFVLTLQKYGALGLCGRRLNPTPEDDHLEDKKKCRK